jgi:hypothetical protein
MYLGRPVVDRRLFLCNHCTNAESSPGSNGFGGFKKFPVFASSFSEIIISIIPGDSGSPGSISGPIDAAVSTGI